MRTCPSCSNTYEDNVLFCPRDSAALAPDASAQSGMVGMLLAGRYRVLKKIGDGGMGSVFEAIHERLGRKFAIKVLHREYSRNAEVIERFQREARAAAAIGNEHIIDVTDFDVTPDGSFFLAMEYLVGQELRARLRQAGRLPLLATVDYAAQIADALEAAHRLGIVHRDLKPENVFIVRRPDGREILKVLDFGISKMRSESSRLTRTGAVMGTPYYMSPEQARGDADVDNRTDIWALGAMAYEMLTGKMPFFAAEATGILMKILLEEPPPLAQIRTDIPPRVEAAIMRALNKDRAQRQPSCAELVRELAKAADAEDLAPKATLVGLGEFTPSPPPAPMPQPPFVSTPTSLPTALAWQRSETGLSLPGRARSRKILWATCGLILVAGAARIVVWRSGKTEPHRAVAALPPPQEVSPVSVELASVPPGARVQTEDKLVCETTPCVWRTTPSDHSATLEFARAGFITHKRDVIPNHDQSVLVELEAERRPAAVVDPPRLERKKTAPPKPKVPTRKAAPNPFEDP